MTTLNDIPYHIISKIGRYLLVDDDQEKDILHAYTSSKLFSPISHNDTLHRMTITPKTVHYLEDLSKYMKSVKKRKPNLSRFVLRIFDFKNSNDYDKFKNVFPNNFAHYMSDISYFEVIISSHFLTPITNIVLGKNMKIHHLILMPYDNVLLYPKLLPDECDIKDVTFRMHHSHIFLLKDKEFMEKITELVINVEYYDPPILSLTYMREDANVIVQCYNLNMEITKPYLIQSIVAQVVYENRDQVIDVKNFYKRNTFTHLKDIYIRFIDWYKDMNSSDEDCLLYTIVNACPRDTCKFYFGVENNHYICSFLSRIISKYKIPRQNIHLVYKCRNTYIIAKICQILFENTTSQNIRITNTIPVGSLLQSYVIEDDLKNMHSIKNLFSLLDEKHKYHWNLLSFL